jgi:signal peptide peptidase SppA
MKYQQVLSSFYGSIWAILPEKLREIEDFLRARAFAATNAVGFPDSIPAGHATPLAGSVGVIQIVGTIAQRVGVMERSSGGISTQDIGAQLSEMAGNPKVEQIAMIFDTPGGSVFGVAELAAKVREVRKTKKVTAVVDSVAASAGYWLASQANEIVLTPGGQVGSIGVMAMHTDVSALEANAGIKTTLISHPERKGEGASEIPLSEVAREEIMGKVRAYYDMFIADVGKGRGVPSGKVDSKYGQGTMLMAADALEAGMVDRIATAEEFFARAVGKRRSPLAEELIQTLSARRRRVAEVLA